MLPCRLLSILLLALLAVACGGKNKNLAAGDGEPSHSAGPAGAVILAGSLEAANGLALSAFFDRLDGGSAALVPTDSITPSDPMQEIVSAMEKSAGRSDFVHSVDVPYINCARTESRENGDILYDAKGAWFYANRGGSAQLMPCLLRSDGSPAEVWSQTLELSKRGGVIAGSGAGAEMLGAVVLDAKRKDYTLPAESRWKARPALGLLSGLIVLVMNDPGENQEWLSPPLGLHPGTRALAISPDGAVLVEDGGEKLTLLGGEAYIVRLAAKVDGISPMKAIVIEPVM